MLVQVTTPQDPKKRGLPVIKSHIGTDVVIQAIAEQLKHWQQEDESLREVRRMATSEEMQVTNIYYARATFFYKEGILY